MPRQRARFTQADVDRLFKAAAKTRVNMHLRIEPDGTIDVETMGAMSMADEQRDTPEKISELIRHAAR
jgi:hypothetical protein